MRCHVWGREQIQSTAPVMIIRWSNSSWWNTVVDIYYLFCHVFLFCMICPFDGCFSSFWWMLSLKNQFRLSLPLQTSATLVLGNLFTWNSYFQIQTNESIEQSSRYIGCEITLSSEGSQVIRQKYFPNVYIYSLLHLLRGSGHIDNNSFKIGLVFNLQ